MLRTVRLASVVAAAVAFTSAMSTPAEARPRTRQTGIASFYHDMFHGRQMADGGRFSQHSNYAASRTLPFGTIAVVTNNRNGRSAVVRIRDRGPYVGGRIVDLSRATATQLGFREQGVAPVTLRVAYLPPPRR